MKTRLLFLYRVYCIIKEKFYTIPKRAGETFMEAIREEPVGKGAEEGQTGEQDLQESIGIGHTHSIPILDSHIWNDLQIREALMAPPNRYLGGLVPMSGDTRPEAVYRSRPVNTSRVMRELGRCSRDSRVSRVKKKKNQPTSRQLIIGD